MNVVVAAASVSAGVAGFLLSCWWITARAEERRRRRLREHLIGTDVDSRGARLAGLRIFVRMRARKAKAERRAQVEQHLPEMIDALSLGLGAGLSFESAFRLYCTRFMDPLAQACAEAYRSWDSGLMSREDALRGLAERLDVPVMSRFVSNVLRSLRFGSPLARTLDALAEEARSNYKARIEERVAKAPAKMLMPTTALILPAMLILVMAPIVLDFA